MISSRHSSMKILQHNKGDMPPDIKILKNKFLFDNSHQINNFIVHKQKCQSLSLTFCDLFETQNLPQGPPDIENSGSRKSASHHSHQINNFIVHKQKFQSISLTFCDLFETQHLPKGPPDIENSGSRKSASHHQTIEDKKYVIKVDEQILS